MCSCRAPSISAHPGFWLGHAGVSCWSGVRTRVAQHTQGCDCLQVGTWKVHLVSSTVPLAGPRAAAQVGQGHFFLDLCCHLPILQQSTTWRQSTNGFSILPGCTENVKLGISPLLRLTLQATTTDSKYPRQQRSPYTVVPSGLRSGPISDSPAATLEIRC